MYALSFVEGLVSDYCKVEFLCQILEKHGNLHTELALFSWIKFSEIFRISISFPIFIIVFLNIWYLSTN